MEIIASNGYQRTIKTVTISVNDEHVTTDEIVDAALNHLGENRQSIFGWQVNYFDDEDLWGIEVYTD